MCAKMRLLDTHLLRIDAAEVVLFTVPLLLASSNGTHFYHSSISEKRLLEYLVQMPCQLSLTNLTRYNSQPESAPIIVITNNLKEPQIAIM